MGSAVRTAQRQALRRPLTRSEKKVFSWLTERWSHVLRGRSIPLALRKKMRFDPSFRALVRVVERGEPLIADDLNYVPDRERLLDGTVRDRLQEELGGDPREYICRCGGEKLNAADTDCPDCRAPRRNRD